MASNVLIDNEDLRGDTGSSVFRRVLRNSAAGKKTVVNGKTSQAVLTTRDLQSGTHSSQADQQKRPNTEQERPPSNFFASKHSGDLTKPGKHAQTSIDSGLSRSTGNTSQVVDDRVCRKPGLVFGGRTFHDLAAGSQ